MRKLKNLVIALLLIATGAAMTACSSGGSGSGSAIGGGTGGTSKSVRYVLSGNNDGTISVFRNDSTPGYATAVAYIDAGGGFAVRDMIYDAANDRVIAITDNRILVLGYDAASGEAELLDQRSTSGNSSHLAVNSSGTAAYVASGASSGKSVDFYTIGASGTLSLADTTSLGVDPDYIRLDPAESRLYVVSRTNAQVLIFDLDTDHSLVSGPQTVTTGSSPTALGFNLPGTTAYLTRADNSDNLVVYSVDTGGGLSQTTALSNSNNPVDMVLSPDGAHLYVLDSSNKQVNHYTIDSATGEPAYVANTSVSFTATDLTLSPSGDFLYVGHSEDDLVSTIAVDASDGSLSVVNWVRAFNSVNAVLAIGGSASGNLQPTATYLLVPDQTGLSRFAIGASGALSLDAVENTAGAMIDGEVAVDYFKGLVLGAGEDATGADLLTSYVFNPVTGGTTAVDTIDATVSVKSSFQRIEPGRSGRFMYVLDEGILDSVNQEKGTIRTYAYAANGTITPAQVDADTAYQAPENLSLHPAGRFIYAINSFGDTISRFEINETDGTLSGGTQYTPGNTGSNAGRPVDMRFHPNGRYAYVSLEDDGQLVRYVVETNGELSNLSRTTLPAFNGAAVEPGPIAVHPGGKYLYAGERNTSNTISVLSINSSNYSLTHQSRISAAGNPSWISVDPQGRYLYVRFADESIQVFSIDANTGNLTDTQQVISAGNSAGLYPSMTLVAPLQ